MCSSARNHKGMIYTRIIGKENNHNIKNSLQHTVLVRTPDKPLGSGSSSSTNVLINKNNTPLNFFKEHSSLRILVPFLLQFVGICIPFSKNTGEGNCLEANEYCINIISQMY